MTKRKQYDSARHVASLAERHERFSTFNADGTVFEPSHDEIEAVCEQIQAGWSEDMKQKRAGAYSARPVSLIEESSGELGVGRSRRGPPGEGH